jgi:hypothetical protein
VVHVEEVEKVQHLIETHPISLNVFSTGGILRDQCTDNGKECKENEEGNGEFKRTKQVIDNGKKTTFFGVDGFLRFFHSPF